MIVSLSALLFITVVFGLVLVFYKKDNLKTFGVIKHIKTSDKYPLETNETITWWVELHSLVQKNYGSLNDTPFAAELKRQTGVNIEFVHPPRNEANSRLRLMFESGTTTDIIESAWFTDTERGLSKLIKEGHIIRLNDVIEKVSPNFKKYLITNPEIEKSIKTPENDYAYYPMMRGDKRLSTFRGFMVRSDLMEKVGVRQIPTTIDELESLLYKFKEMNVEIPISILQNDLIGRDSASLSGAYGFITGFYLEDGIVKFGCYEPKFKEYITLLAKWYKDGLLDKNFTDNDFNRLGEEFGEGKIAIVYASAGGHFGAWIPILQQNVVGADVEPLPYPSLVKGKGPRIGQYNGTVDRYGAVISAKCKNIELAARVLDFGYSTAGKKLYNFGIEGISYTMDDGIPKYTENVLFPNVAEGGTIGGEIARYARAAYYGPFIQDINYIDQYYQLPPQKKALEIWSYTDAKDYVLPLMILTEAESSKLASIMENVYAAQAEMATKFINGQLELNDIDMFFIELENLGIEEAIRIQQQAYNRYISS